MKIMMIKMLEKVKEKILNQQLKLKKITRYKIQKINQAH